MRNFYFFISVLFFLNPVFSQEKLDVFDIARKGTIYQIEAMFKENPEIINTNNEHGFSPLILACYNGNEAVAHFLIEKANLDYVSNEGTALMAAVVKGNVRTVNLLLNKGANPNLTNKQGTTALIYAVQFKNLEIIRLLLKFKASKTQIDKQGKTAFEYAVFSNNEDVINLLK